MLIHLINFLRQSVTILGEHVLLGRFSQTSCLIPLSKFPFFTIGMKIGKMKEFEWQLLRYFPLRLVFPSMDFAFMVEMYCVTLAGCFSPIVFLLCYSQVASIITLQIKPLYTYYWYAWSQPQRTNSCENCRTHTPRTNLAHHKKVLLLGDYFVPSVPIFPQSPEIKRSITLPRNTLKQLPGLFINAKYVTKTFTAFAICENINEGNTEHKEVQELKMLMLHT